MDKKIKIGLVIMASGLGKRFGSNKLMVPLENKPLVKWIIDTTDGLFDKRVVVTRSKEVEDLCKTLGIECVYHTFPDRNDTVRLGLNSLKNDVDYCFFVPGDQPLIKRETILKMLDEVNGNNSILRTGLGQTVSAPVGFSKIFYEELLALPKGKGGNFVVNRHLSEVHVILAENEYELLDIDTREDLEKIRNILKTCN